MNNMLGPAAVVTVSRHNREVGERERNKKYVEEKEIQIIKTIVSEEMKYNNYTIRLQ